MAPSDCSDSLIKSNHFFKIILSDRIDSHEKLLIPRKFVRKQGKNLHDNIYLKVPNGLVWPVDLKKHEDDIWLQKGWPEFARFYSIQFGYMLVFEYKPHSVEFDVLIFDPSSTEIDYPISTKCANIDSSGKSSQVSKRLNEMDVSTSFDTTRPPKKTKPNVSTKGFSHNGVCLMPKSESGDSEFAIDKEANYQGRALASAQAFRSNNPFFVVSMKPSHVDGRGNGMVVDKASKEIYINWKNNDQVNLKVDGRSWLVECDMKWNMCRLRGGWDKFVKENSLSVDDVCVFELIDAFNKLFHVFIYRARKETSCAKGDGEFAIDEEVNCKGIALASAQTFRSNFPFFVVAMTRSSVEGKGHGMNVPMAFEKSFKNWKTNDQVNLQVEKKSWLVNCYRLRNRCWMKHGWDTFAQENSLSVDDVCVFELIDAHKKLFRIFIYRATNEGTGNYRLPVLASANAFKSKNPFCTVKMRPSYVHGGSVHLPSKFIHEYITKNQRCNVIFQVSDGRAWSVTCCTYGSSVKFRAGWKNFVQANNLAEGDDCVFELINRSKKLFNVVVFRTESSELK